jgi:hypothetical protein
LERFRISRKSAMPAAASVGGIIPALFPGVKKKMKKILHQLT